MSSPEPEGSIKSIKRETDLTQSPLQHQRKRRRWGKLEDQGSEDEEIEVELRKTKLQMKEIELEKKLRKKRRQV